METIDIENIDFNEYNRRVYEEEENDNYSINKLSKKIFHLNPQKRYEIEINNYIKEFNKISSQKKISNLENEVSKKKKF